MFSKPSLMALCIAKHSLLLEQGADSFSVAPSPRPAAPRFDPIEADEVAAFKQALASAGRPAAAAAPGVPVRSGPSTRSSPLLHNDFADTEMPEDSRAQPLSSTQYGDL